MEREITSIPLVKANSGIPCHTPDPDATLVDENDPAIKVMTDFKTVIPITIEANVNIDIALNKMRSLGVRLLFVTDELDNIAGVITSYEIQGETPIKYAQENGISHDRILINMLMIPLEEFAAFDFDFVQQSVVRHVVKTIRELERPHALVIEFDKLNNKQTIRGMFSSTQISKLLGKGVYAPLHAGHSLAEIQHEIEHPRI